jgi:hypothetical protein
MILHLLGKLDFLGPPLLDLCDRSQPLAVGFFGPLCPDSDFECRDPIG